MNVKTAVLYHLLLRCKIHPWWRCPIFKTCVTLYQSWTPPKTQSQSLTSNTFCDNRFWDMLPFSQLCEFVRKWKVHFTFSRFQAQMMPVAKATAITQVTDPSCELRPVIGLSTGGVYRLSVLIGWLVGRGRGPGRQRFCREHWFNRLASGQTVGAHTHTHTHTHTHIYIQTAGRLEVQGEIWPSGGHLCGSERMCV